MKKAQARQTIIIDNKNYIIGEILGQGNSGTVYALNSETGEPSTLALKQFNSKEKAEQEYLAHQASIKDEPCYLKNNTLIFKRHNVCRFGANLLAVICNPDFKPDAKALAAIGIFMLIAIEDYHHDSNRVHCDLALENLILTTDAQVKLIDFGSSKPIDDKTPVEVRKQYYLPALDHLDEKGIAPYFDYWVTAISLMQIFLKPEFRTMMFSYRFSRDNVDETTVTQSPTRPKRAAQKKAHTTNYANTKLCRITTYQLRDCISINAKTALVNWFNDNYCTPDAINNPENLPNTNAMIKIMFAIANGKHQAPQSRASNPRIWQNLTPKTNEQGGYVTSPYYKV